MTKLLITLLLCLAADAAYDMNYIESFTPESFLNVRFLRNAAEFPYLIKFYNPRYVSGILDSIYTFLIHNRRQLFALQRSSS